MGTTCSRFEALTNKCLEETGDRYDLSDLKSQGMLGGQDFPDMRDPDVHYYLSVCQPVQGFVKDQAMVQTCKNTGGEDASKAVAWQYSKEVVSSPKPPA